MPDPKRMILSQALANRKLLYAPILRLLLKARIAVVMLALCASAPIDVLAQPAGETPIADVAGPGQPVARPASQCPRTLACKYAEQNVSGYRLQSVLVCGANCTTQYWVSNTADGQQLLELDPTRGGAVVAIGRSDHPPVRIVMPSYADTDPACCPSAIADTTYSWDASNGTLVPGEVLLTPADQFPGYDATREALSSEGWIVANV